MTDNLHSASGLASAMPPLLLEAQKVAHTFMKGVHGRRRVGLGETFWQFRHYQPGDASRDIDWRQTAKRDDAFVRQREWEASQTLWLYRDATASMYFTGHKSRRTKKDYAELLLLALSMIALDGGEQAGLLGADLAPQSHASAVERLYTHLPQQVQLTETGRPVSAHAQAVLLSDFFQPIETLAAFCERLSQRRVMGTLVQIFDPAEEALPYKGRVKFYDIEDASAPALSIQQVESVREEYERRFAAHQQALEQVAKGCGWHFMAARTDEAPEAVLARLYEQLAAR